LKIMIKNSTNRSLIFLMIGVFLLMSVLLPHRFLTLSNVFSMAYQLPIIAFLSLGMMIAMLSGGINLAIIATANFTGIITYFVLQALTGGATTEASVGVSIIALFAGLVAALFVGAVMGFLIAYIEVPAILATLAVMILMEGVNVVITKGYTLSGLPPLLLDNINSRVIEVPLPFILFIIIAVILAVVLRKTVFGKSLYWTGANPVAAEFSNINVRLTLVSAYMLSAFFSALAAFVMMGQLNSIKADYASAYLLVTVLACFLGGTDPFGGTGNLSGMVFSVIILQLISTGVTLLRMDPYFIDAMWGMLIILLIVINKITSQLQEKRRLNLARQLQHSPQQE